MRARFFVAAGTAALALTGSVFAASPALAAADTTNVTFTLTAGALAIDAPATADLGAVGTSSSATAVSGQLGDTTVTDGRGGLLSAYVVNLSSGDFTTGAAGPNETILGSTVTAFSGTATHTNATVTKVALETSTLVPAATPIMGLSAYNGTDTSVYNPTVNIPVPATNAAGDYAGVITQTVTAV
jgi:hypothetical protein